LLARKFQVFLRMGGRVGCLIPVVMPGLREMATKGADIRIDTELGLFYLLFEFLLFNVT